MKIANLQQQLESSRHQMEVVRTNVELESISFLLSNPEFVAVSPKKLLVSNPNYNVATPKFGSNSALLFSPQIRGEDASAGGVADTTGKNQGFFGRGMSSSTQTLRRVVFSPFFHTRQQRAQSQLTQQLTESDARSRVGSRGEVDSRRWSNRRRFRIRR